jgi:hypothetical protein
LERQVLAQLQTRELLEAESVGFDRSGKVDLKRVRWPGPQREWLTKLRHEFPF